MAEEDVFKLTGRARSVSPDKMLQDKVGSFILKRKNK